MHGLRPSLGRVAAYNASSPERGIGHALRLSEPGAEMALARIRHELELCGNEVASQDAARSHEAP